MSFASGGLQTLLVMVAFNSISTGLKKGVDYLKSQQPGGAAPTVKGFLLTFLSGTLEVISANTTNPVAPKVPDEAAK